MCKGACSINQIHTEAVDWGFHFSCLTGVQDEFLRSSDICAFTDVADTIIALCQGGGEKKKNQTGRNKRNRTISRKHLFKSGNKSCKLRGIMWKLCYNLLNCWQCNTANAISVIIIIKYPFSSDFKQKCIVWADQTVYALNVSQDILEPSRLPGMSTTLSSAKWICRISVRKGRQNV